MNDDTISRAAAIDAMMKLQTEDIEAYGASIPEGFDGDRAVTALKALPSAQLAQDLPKGCTDTISREAAIETVRKAKSIGQAHRMLVQLPSAQPERKKGKWIERNPQNSPDCRLIECSECGNAYIVGYNINYDDWIDGRNFCMKCGADLRGSNGKNT